MRVVLAHVAPLLEGHAANERLHSAIIAPEQVDQIAASLREFGWTIPVLVDEGGELIAGHGRLRAARLLGLDDAPVLVAKGWSEAQKRAYRIADNKLALNSGWDTVLLSGELAALAGEGLAADLLGFSDADMARLVDDTDRLTLEHAAAAAAAVNPTDWRHAAAQPDTGPHIDASAPRQTDYGRSFADKNLRRMVQFAAAFPDESIVVPVSTLPGI